MRRRRRGLQVSTFPFLAVLLCAMGSLILLLLVIDRRAKAVARAKIEQAAAHVLADDAKMTAARQAEWEQRRRELHELLAREEEEVAGQVKAVHGKTAAAATEVETAQARFRALRQRLEAEAGGLVRKKDELTARRASVARAGQKAEASKQQLAQLAAELDRLEQTLCDLRALREREKQTYSLIPYFGRRGDDRRPIYVECTAAGLVFHPDRLVLEGPGLDALAIRSEVERRIARQRAALPAPAPGAAKTEPSAYLLMLVRPDGIASYYHTQDALVGLKIEFGYEFVERDWILDFSADDNAAAAQPWMTAGKDRKLPPPRVPPATPAPRPVPAAGVRGGFMATGPGADGSVGLPGPGRAGPGVAFGGPGSGPGGFGPPGEGTGNSERDGGATLLRPQLGLGGSGGPAGATTTGAPAGSILGGSPGGPSFSATGGTGQRGTTSPGPRRGPAGVVFGGSDAGPPGFGSTEGGPRTGANGPGGIGRPSADAAMPADGKATAGTGLGFAGPAIGGPPHLAAGNGTGQGPGGMSNSGTPVGPGSAGSIAGTGTPTNPGGASGSAGTEAGPWFASRRPGAPASAIAAPGSGQPTPPDNSAAGTHGDGASTTGPGLAQGAAGSGPAGTGPAAGGVSPGASPGPGAAQGDPPGTGAPGVARAGASSPGASGSSGEPSGRGGAPMNSEPGGASGQANAGGGTGAGSGSPGEGGSGGGVAMPRFLAGNPLTTPTSRPARTAPVPLSRLIGNRDWPITIEFLADTVWLRTTGLRVPVASLGAAERGELRLVQAVQKLVADRQATVRPGEPPYRPILRFQVHPDGLRGYYLAYPLLEALRIPMTRENVVPPPPPPRTIDR